MISRFILLLNRPLRSRAIYCAFAFRKLLKEPMRLVFKQTLYKGELYHE